MLGVRGTSTHVQKGVGPLGTPQQHRSAQSTEQGKWEIRLTCSYFYCIYDRPVAEFYHCGRGLLVKLASLSLDTVRFTTLRNNTDPVYPYP